MIRQPPRHSAGAPAHRRNAVPAKGRFGCNSGANPDLFTLYSPLNPCRSPLSLRFPRKTEYGLLVDIEEVPGSIPGTHTIIFNDLGVPNAPAQAVWVPFRCICQDSSGGAGTAGSVSRGREMVEE